MTPPSPWQKISTDLNKGSGGLYIFLFKLVRERPSRRWHGSEEYHRATGRESGVPLGFQWDNTDLNKSVGGEFLCSYGLYSVGPSAIMDVDVVSGDNRAEALNKKPQDWDFVDVDLNKGAGGEFIYLIYRRA